MSDLGITDNVRVEVFFLRYIQQVGVVPEVLDLNSLQVERRRRFEINFLEKTFQICLNKSLNTMLVVAPTWSISSLSYQPNF